MTVLVSSTSPIGCQRIGADFGGPSAVISTNDLASVRKQKPGVLDPTAATRRATTEP